MKQYLKALLAVALFTLSTSTALGAAPKQMYSPYGTVINGVALSAASSSFTVNFDNPTTNGIPGLIVVWVSVTDASNSVTAINMSCTGSPNNGTTDYTLQDCSSTAGGVCTSANASWTKDPSAITSPKRWPWRVDIEGMPEVECVFTDTGGDASDSITVTVSFATKG